MTKERLTAILTIVGGGLILIVFLMWNTNLSVPEITPKSSAENTQNTPVRPSQEVSWQNAFSPTITPTEKSSNSPSSTVNQSSTY